MSFRKSITLALMSTALMVFPLAGQAMLIDKQLVLRPIQICNNVGDCANEAMELFEDVGDAIWAQAGIDLMFEEFTSVIDQRSFEVSFSELTGFNGFGNPPGPTWFETAIGGISDTNVINLWFTKSIEGVGETILGVADGDADATGFFIEVVRNNILMSEQALRGFFRDPAVMAHEIGHVLGLSHCDYRPLDLFPYIPCPLNAADVSAGLNLMRPSAFGGRHLTNAQAELARQSEFLIDFEPVPLPAPWSLLCVGVALLFGRRCSTNSAVN